MSYAKEIIGSVNAGKDVRDAIDEVFGKKRPGLQTQKPFKKKKKKPGFVKKAARKVGSGLVAVASARSGGYR